ncbi:MAG: circadian clock protein KaiC [Pseudomonas sp.]
MAETPSATGQIATLKKVATGITGFDEITLGGLPLGRPSLICGYAGCGKTLFAMSFLVNGATQYGEPGVFMSFEERTQDLMENVGSLDYDLQALVDQNLLAIDHVYVDSSEIEETGEYDLEGLFVRLGYAIDSIGAKRVVLDTIEALFSSFQDAAVLRAELRRLFYWLKERGVTAVVTGERGEGLLTRFGIEEYVSDCVILLDNRVAEQITTRRLRVVKYRGSSHGTNEYPFFIDEQGITVMPITGVELGHQALDEVVPTGIAGLDRMLDRSGYFRGSSVLVTGLAGTGKTTFAASFASATCLRGERCLLFSFEESESQLLRNLGSVGLQLQTHIDKGLLRIQSARPSLYGLEVHLARMYREVAEFQPAAVIIDPISAFHGPQSEVHATLLRLVDMLKQRGITAVFTSLSDAKAIRADLDRAISSLMDTWISLNSVDADGEYNRLLYVLKARGMGHSNQVREYHIDNRGISLVTPYIGSSGVLTGTARLNQEARERREAEQRKLAIEQRKRDKQKNRAELERRIAEMRAALDAQEQEESLLDGDESRQLQSDEDVRQQLAAARGVVE